MKQQHCELPAPATKSHPRTTSRKRRSSRRSAPTTPPVATSSGHLTFGDTVIPCYVLDNGTHLLGRGPMLTALGIPPVRGRPSGKSLVHFLTRYRLLSFGTSGLLETAARPVLFQTLHGAKVCGYPAALLADICDAVLAAHSAGVLRNRRLLDRYLVLYRAFAPTGIDVLVDQACASWNARQTDTPSDMMALLLTPEMQRWVCTFPSEFWIELARLEGYHEVPERRPFHWGKFIMKYVYEAIDPETADWLRANNRKPGFQHNHHQFLQKLGRACLRKHLAQLVRLMNASSCMEEFRTKFQKAATRKRTKELSRWLTSGRRGHTLPF